MVTHYDMLTGEMIVDEIHDPRGDQPRPAQSEVRLQLLSVAEAQLADRYTAPAGVLVIPADQLMGD